MRDQSVASRMYTMRNLVDTPALQETARRYDEAFPAVWLEETAKDVGFVKRVRDFDPVLFFWTLVLRTGISLQTSLVAIERGYNRMAEEVLAHSTLHEKYTPELVAFMRACVDRGLQYLGSIHGGKLSERLEMFSDVLIQDSSIIRLHEKLSKKWPATRSRKVAAGVKLAALVSVVGEGPTRVRLHPERTPEIKTLRLGPWVKDRLLLFDLGFFKYQAFARIRELGGSFVSRLKTTSNPLIVRQLKTVRGNSINVEGEYLQDVLKRLKRQVLDVVVEVEVKRRKYKGKVSREVQELRVIAIYNVETKKYHTYVTNLSPDDFEAKDIASLYRMRWEVELLFKEMKSQFHIHHVPTSSEHAAETIIWTGVLTTLMSRILFVTMQQMYPDKKVSPRACAIEFTEHLYLMFYCAILQEQGRPSDPILVDEILGRGMFTPYRETRTHLQEWRA